MEGNGIVFDWSQYEVSIADEFLAKKGLQKRRRQLENILAGGISSKPTVTGHTLLFKGRRQYLKPFTRQLTEKECLFVGNTIKALQFLYHLEAAWKAGDIDRALRMAIGFADAYTRAAVIETHGQDFYQAVSAMKKLSAGRAKGGRKSAKWKPEFQESALAIFAQEKRGKASDDAAYRRTATKLNSQFGTTLSKDTVKRHLTKRSAQQ